MGLPEKSRKSHNGNKLGFFGTTRAAFRFSSRSKRSRFSVLHHKSLENQRYSFLKLIQQQVFELDLMTQRCPGEIPEAAAGESREGEGNAVTVEAW
jgi:hypothetical protein